MDVFVEYIVKKEKGFKEYATIFLIILAVLTMFFVCIPLIVGLIGNIMLLTSALYVGTLYLAYFAFIYQNVEYEYILTDSFIDIDTILGRRKRKRLLTVDCKDFEVLAPANSGGYIKEYHYSRVLDYSSYRENPRNYFAIFEQEGETVCLIFEPNETMLKNIKKFIPSKVTLDENI